MKLENIATKLFLHEILHFVSGIMVGLIIYCTYTRLDLSLIAFFASIFVDSDHFFESIILYRFNPLLIIKKTKCNSWLESGKMTILFHSWELILLIFFLGRKFDFFPLSVAIDAALFLHLLIDTVIYSVYHKMPIYNYSFFYRAWVKFDFVKLYNNGKEKYMSREEIVAKYEKK